jgi:hypothetical protein
VYRTPPHVQDAMFAGIYLKVHNAPKLEAIMASLKAWKADEVQGLSRDPLLTSPTSMS